MRLLFGALLTLAASCSHAPKRQTVAPAQAAEGVRHVLVFSAGDREEKGRFISGSAPEGEAGFAALAAMGVRTIISVDGISPDIESARRHSMRYVHIPIRYNGVTEDQRLALARAARDLPRPIYIHCHHGQHRGPTAAAVALESIGEIEVAQGLALMREAGTADSYPGLWAAARGAAPISDAALDAWHGELVPVARVSGIAKNMSELDRAWDNINLFKANRWRVPADHPDLVASAEAASVREHLRALLDEDECRAKPDPFLRWLAAANEEASALEEALVSAAPASLLDQRRQALADSCARCHGRFRN